MIRVELFEAYTLHMNVSKDLTLYGMAGVVSLTSSVHMDIGSSPRRLIVSTMGSLYISSRERKAVIQVLLDSPTNFPPQSAPVKWWPNRALDLCLPTYFTRSRMSISRCFALFPVRTLSVLSAPQDALVIPGP